MNKRTFATIAILIFALAVPSAHAKRKKKKKRTHSAISKQTEEFVVFGQLSNPNNGPVTGYDKVEIECCFKLYYDGQMDMQFGKPSLEGCQKVVVDKNNFKCTATIPVVRKSPTIGAQYWVRVPGSDKNYKASSLASNLFVKVPASPPGTSDTEVAEAKNTKISGRTNSGRPEANIGTSAPSQGRAMRGLAGAAGGP